MTVRRGSAKDDFLRQGITTAKEDLKYVMLFITKSDRTAIFITLPRPLGLGFETLIFRP
jgi:hypothetical protein